MQIDRTVVDEIEIVALEGRLDTNTSSSLEKVLLQVTQEVHHKVVVDFDQLTFISSSGLRVLLTAAKQSKRLTGKMVLCGLKDHVMQVFDVAGFTMLFTMRQSRDEAVEGLR